MTVHSDSFVVHADYVPAGFLESPILVAYLLFVYGVVFIIVALYARSRDSKRSSREPKPDAYKSAETISTVVGVGILGVSIILIGGMKTSSYITTMSDIDTIITAPEDCAISSGTGIKSSDTINAVSELPEGQKRATYHVNATCKKAESLQQLLELDESIVPLDQQPVNAGVES